MTHRSKENESQSELLLFDHLSDAPNNTSDENDFRILLWAQNCGRLQKKLLDSNELILKSKQILIYKLMMQQNLAFST